MSGCVSPLSIIDRLTGLPMQVPCGKCWYCTSSRRAQWTFRLSVENYCWLNSEFLTLTYDDEHLPLNSFGLPTLNVDHLNKFIKDLRNNKFKFKYYAIGEYGGRFGRPHYHVLIFFNDDIQFPLFWHNGNLKEDNVTPADIHYVTKFHVVPKLSRFEKSVIQPQFARMSKHLGYSWLSNFLDFETGEIKQELPDFIKVNGYCYPVPRYFRKLLLSPRMEFDFPFDKFCDEYGFEKAVVMVKALQQYSDKKLNEFKQHLPVL